MKPMTRAFTVLGYFLCAQIMMAHGAGAAEEPIDEAIKRSRAIQVELATGVDLPKMERARQAAGQLRGLSVGPSDQASAAHKESRMLISAVVSAPQKIKTMNDPGIIWYLVNVTLESVPDDLFADVAGKVGEADLTAMADAYYTPIAQWVRARREEIIPGFADNPAPIPKQPKSIDRSREPLVSRDFLDPSLVLDAEERKLYTDQLAAFRSYSAQIGSQQALPGEIMTAEKSLAKSIMGSSVGAIASEAYFRKIFALTGASKERIDALWDKAGNANK